MTSSDFDSKEHDDFGGLHRDLPQIVDRRRALQWVGGLSLAGLIAACGSDGGSVSDGETGTAAEIPDETGGPFPADGSNGPNVLIEDGVVRTDITNSIGSFAGAADGVPTTFELTIVDAATGDPLPGAAVYIWHCTAGGAYSVYEIEDQNYLRGVQVADDAGRLAFVSIFPGCYSGRWPHCHFEVYDSLDAATAVSEATKVSQFALPQSDCEAVYADDDRYAASVGNLSELSLETDGVFSDGWEDQLATVTIGPTSGITASLLVRV